MSELCAPKSMYFFKEFYKNVFRNILTKSKKKRKKYGITSLKEIIFFPNN